MSIREKISKRYEGVEGGLFSKVTKADVGEGFAEMGEEKVTLMGWADPFYPDPSLPKSVADAMIREIESGFPAHYIMPSGSPELREMIAGKLKEKNQLDADPKRNIIITPGSDSGLFYAVSLFIGQGDEALVPDPSYPNNFMDPKLLGGKAVSVPLNEAEGYAFDMDAFERAVTDRTKAVILTHPNNPTTRVYRREELEKLSEFIIRHDLVLIVDQAFEETVLDEIEFVTPASLPGMWERTVTVFSISKGMALSGLRVGYIVACDKIMDVMYGAAVNVLGAANSLAQAGAMAAFQNDGYVKKYLEKYDYRRKQAYEIFSAVEGVEIQMPESGFYCWIDVSRLGDSTEIMEYLVKEARVAVNDGKAYGTLGAGHLRIIHGCLGSDEEAVAALHRMAEALGRYQQA